MKQVLRKLCQPLLQRLEQGTEPYVYKPLNRKLLIVAGCLFLFLALGLAVALMLSGKLAALLPLIVFVALGFLCLVVGWVGSDRAVSKLWFDR